jgi:multidrug efflux pump subunit AcrA (membrane-fusion protein)
MKQKVIAVIGAVLVAVTMTVSLAGCNKGASGVATLSAAEIATTYAVSTYTVQAGNWDADLEFGGDVAAASSVDILPDAAGKLVRVLVRPGDRVTRNQLVAEVDPSRPGMNYALSPIRSPIEGTVTSLPIPIGSTVAPSMSIGKISTASNLEITVNVAERYVSRIALGQSALLSFDAYPAERFNARVVEVSPVLNVASRTMEAKLHLVNPDARIKIGMYARVRLITDARKDAIIVPYDAMVRRSGTPFVFVVRGNNGVNMVTVTEGIRVDDRIEILEGLKAGDQIVVKGQTLLDEGSKVNVISQVSQ